MGESGEPPPGRHQSQRGGQGATSGALWYAILGSWALATAILVWRFLPELSVSPSLPALIYVLVCLSFFVLSGIFNVAVNVASHLLRTDRKTGGVQGTTPRVAVLYCTYNDFDRSAADTMMQLTYSPVELWLLDDSSRQEVQTEVDRFAREAAESGRRVRVVRRPDRKGFKAGAINNALRLLSPDVEYVAIIDADERLAPDFVQGCLRHFTSDEIGFVQANHRSANGDVGWFTRYLGVGVDLHWRHYQPYRNRYGTVNMLGHGALLRRDVLEEIGGFPELTCEDIAFTVEARIAGYRGAFATDVVCGESFPADFSAMRRRHLRWCWGTTEFLRHYAVRFLRSRARLHEKLDLLLPSGNLPSVLLVVGFLAVLQGLRWSGATLAAFSDPIVLILGAIAILGPLLVFVDLARQPLFALKTIAVNTVAYLALFPLSVVGVLRGLLRPAEFLVTPKGASGPLSLRRAASEARVELAFGTVLLLLSFAAVGPLGLVGSAIALASLFVPLLMAYSRTVPPSRATAPPSARES